MGCKMGLKKNRPYFEGHEREDVVVKRNEFVNYFDKTKTSTTMGIRMQITTQYLMYPLAISAF